ncbi:MAG: response regulator [Pseudonocardiaceae bacterium]
MANTITAIASLLWPILVAVGLLVFRSPLVHVVRFFEGRKMTIEVGGQKLTIDELSAQQANQIEDLQDQLGALNKVVEALVAAQPTPVSLPGSRETVLARSPDSTVRTSISEAPGDKPFAVLWVDDHPENNAFLIERLQQNGVRVDLARSTQEGLSWFSHRRYRVVLSDMGRSENGAYVPDAGLRLVKAIRQTDQSVPLLILCSGRALREYGEKAVAAGATTVTSSAYRATAVLRTLELL